jgi:RNA polymerase sigma-70 factor (ECF subfamily)
MRLSRVAGNEWVELPVISTVTPGIFAIRPRQSPAAALISRGREPDADLYMKDEASGNSAKDRFQAICRALRPDLLRFAFWLSRDLALAEDVVQETMLRAWRARDSLKDEAAAKPWFLTIIRREYARSFERKRLATVDVDELIAREEPMLAAAQDERVAEVRAALFKLAEEYREPLVMQVLMGYSTAEIAAELGLSSAAVLTRLFRGRKRLRELCGEDTSGDPDECQDPNE